MKPLNAEVHLSRVSEVFFSRKREEARLDYQPLFEPALIPQDQRPDPGDGGNRA